MLTLRRSLALLVVLLMPAALAVCGGEGEGGESGAAPEGGAAPAAVAVENPGVLTGRVAFAGTAPAGEPIDMSEEPTCAQKHSTPPVRQAVAVSDDGMLRNVFVYVKEGLSGSFPAPGEAVVLDQDGCEYRPHVLGVQAGQPLSIKNSDGLLHNINASPSENRGFNISQPTNMESSRTFNSPEVMIPVRCDVHGWMESYIGVTDHPYFAVTGEDGSFRIENLPPGDYVIETWHESLGTQTQNVTVAPNGTAELQFRYDASASTTAMVPLGEPLDPHPEHASRASSGGR